MPSVMLTEGATTGVIAEAVANVDLSGVLNEIIYLLPVVIPVVIGFIGLRKGIKFFFSTLRSA